MNQNRGVWKSGVPRREAGRAREKRKGGGGAARARLPGDARPNERTPTQPGARRLSLFGAAARRAPAHIAL